MVSPAPYHMQLRTGNSQSDTLKLTAETVPGIAGLKGCLLTGTVDNSLLVCSCLTHLPVTSCADLTKSFNVSALVIFHTLCGI